MAPKNLRQSPKTEWWREARTRLLETVCEVCELPTFYISTYDRRSDNLNIPTAPLTCGRLRCLIANGEWET